MSLLFVIALLNVFVFHTYTTRFGENSFITLNHSFSVLCIDFIMSFVSGNLIFIVYINLLLRDNSLEAGALRGLGDWVFCSFVSGAPTKVDHWSLVLSAEGLVPGAGPFSPCRRGPTSHIDSIARLRLSASLPCDIMRGAAVRRM